MDTSKLSAAAMELRAEAARCIRTAEELEGIVQRSGSNGSKPPPVLIQPRTSRVETPPKSALLTAIDVLKEQGTDVHIKSLVDLVSKRRGIPTARASIESVLVRAIKDKKFGLKRTAPGTFAVG